MENSFNIYTGSETGLLKAVNLNKKTWCNINKPSSQDRKTLLSEGQIEALCWNDDSESEACLGLTNQTICVYDVTSKDFVNTYSLASGIENDTLINVAKYDDNFVVCTKSGSVKVWSTNESEPECKVELKSGDSIDSMQQNKSNPQLIATGGKKNDLKIWDLNDPKGPIFKAKNVRNDFLNLEVPVWITDMAFIPESEKLVTCTGHHQIRMYDPSQQRRPVMDFEWDEHPIKKICLRSNGYQALVGNTHGDMALVDFRGKAYVVQKYKGGAGSIRGLQCHPTQDIVASCGLDRYLRIHDINTRKLLQKFYLKSKLNCLLFSSEKFEMDIPVRPKKSSKGKSNDGEISDDSGNGDGEDVWEQIDDVKDKATKRKVENEEKQKKKQKKRKKVKPQKMDIDSDDEDSS